MENSLQIIIVIAFFLRSVFLLVLILYELVFWYKIWLDTYDMF